MYKDKAVLYIYSGGVKEVLLNENARDNCSEPFINLKNSIEKAGFKFDWSKKRNIENYNWIIFHNMSSAGRLEPHRVLLRRIKGILTGNPIRNAYEEALQKKLHERMILLITEEPSIVPENYNEKYHMNFRYILTWSDSLVSRNGGGKYIKYYYPVTEIFPEVDEVPFEHKKLITIIAGNKRSRHPRELYSERLKIINYLQENFSSEFDLYGTGWNNSSAGTKNESGSRFSAYRGEVKNKWDVLPKYKFSICYENMFGEPGNVTEKIFDALRCKTVPVYLGAPNIADYVDENAFIDRRKFNSDEELMKYLTGMNRTEYEKMRSAGDTFINSKEFGLFKSDNFVDTFLSIINKY